MRTQRIRISTTEPAGSGGLLRTGLGGAVVGVLALVAGGAVVVAALFVSAIVFSLLLVAGTVAGGWFWWKTRSLRKSLRERVAQRQQAAVRSAAMADDPNGQVLDGDFIRETDGRTTR